MLLLATILSVATAVVQARELSPDELKTVYDLAIADSSLSWENGTLAQCMIEREYTSLSVFSTVNPFPLPDPIPSDSIPRILSLAQATLQNRPHPNGTDATAPGSLLEDGAAADPCSLLPAIMLAERSVGNEQQIKGVGYADAAVSQIRFTLEDVPRTPSGAISHRVEQAQLWSDSVFMVPPSLAFAGVLLNNQTLVSIAHEQCQLYREGMRNESAGLWAHILLGTGIEDRNRWLTGNSWAAYGMMRVLSTIQWSPWAGEMGAEIEDLKNWVTEIVSTSEKYLTPDNLLRNYIDDESSFEDAAGTALMAATTFRMSNMNLTDNYIPMGLKMLAAVSRHVNSTGHLGQVTDPYSFSKEGDYSPEGQSFVVMAYAAYNEWDAQGRKGAGDDNLQDGDNGASRLAGGGVWVGVLLAVVAGWLVL